MTRRSATTRLLALPFLASALALTSPLPSASAAPADATATPAALPEVVVPGEPLPQPRTETLLAAGAKGFFHTTQDDTFAWTAYDTGATTVVGHYDETRPDPGLHGAGSDFTVDADPRQTGRTWKLQDMSTGAAATVDGPESAWIRGVYGDAVLTEGSATYPGPLRFLRPDGNGGTTVVSVTSWANAGLTPGSTQPLGGDAREAAFGLYFNDGYRIALADTHTGALRVSPLLPSPRTTGGCDNPLMAVDTTQLAWLGGDCKIHVLSRADLNAPDRTVPVDYYDQPRALGLSGDWVLTVNRSGYDQRDSDIPVQRELVATPVGGGDPVVVLSHASETIAQAPDGTALVEGGDTAADWTVRKVTATGGTAPTAVATEYRVAPEAYHLDSLDLSANTLISAEGGNYLGEGFYGRQGTLGDTPTVSARTPLGRDGYLRPHVSCGGGPAICTDMAGTGDGRVVHLNSSINSLSVRRGDKYQEIALDRAVRPREVVGASGRYVLLDTSYWPQSTLAVVDLDGSTPGTTVATASGNVGTIDDGRLITAGAKTGEVVVLDLATQQSRTLQTGRDCKITQLKSAGGWLYWNCWFDGATGSAGLLRPDGTSLPIEVPARAQGMGRGFLVYTPSDEGMSTVVDFHTGVPVTKPLNAHLPADQAFDYEWSADRFGGGLAYVDKYQNIHLVSVIAPDSASL
ncbi:hypothetical protein [Streptomyces sp. LS1784]|uniref:hypothetical protein n=1 Tax=Streptomyces sp. LS1784 TaxID=2851533 RepID=UPI001CCF5186|nr:hypothetical protein [Streptomyces sp. LS1784]